MAKKVGNYYNTIGYVLGLYGDNGKENGNCYNTIGYILGYMGIMERKWKLLSYNRVYIGVIWGSRKRK